MKPGHLATDRRAAATISGVRLMGGKTEMMKGKVCPDAEESPQNRLPHAAAPPHAGPLGLEKGSRFPKTGCSAIFGGELGSHMGNVGYEFMFVAPPLPITRGVGSPIDPQAIE